METESKITAETVRQTEIRGIVEKIAENGVVTRLVKTRSKQDLDYIGRQGNGDATGSFDRYGLMLAQKNGDGSSLVVTENGIRLITTDYFSMADGSLVTYDPDNLVPDLLFRKGECLARISAEKFRNRIVKRLEKFGEPEDSDLKKLLEILKGQTTNLN